MSESDTHSPGSSPPLSPTGSHLSITPFSTPRTLTPTIIEDEVDLVSRNKIEKLQKYATSLSLEDDIIDYANDPRFGFDDDLYFLHPLYDKDVEKGSDFAFTVELSKDDAEIFWFLDGIELTKENPAKYTFACDGTVHVLLVHDVNEGDEGEYVCRAAHRSLDAYITVVENPKGK